MKTFSRILLAGLVASLSACSEEGAFRQTEEGSAPLGEENNSDQLPNNNANAQAQIPETQAKGENGGGGSSAQTPEQEIEATIAKCETSPAQTIVQTINFPNPGQQCAWGQNGNDTIKDREVRAREEQYVNLDVPANKKICNIEFTSPSQQQKFDDEIFITYNGTVLASSQDYSMNAQRISDGSQAYPTGLVVNGNYVSYDWSRLIYQEYGHAITPIYCMGGSSSTCNIPHTETQGAMELSFSNELIVPLALGTSTHTVGFITTGDNDASDCQHYDVDFDITITYVD